MKKHIIFIFVTLISCSIFYSCKQKTVKTIEQKHTERYYLSSDTTKGALNLDINIELPVCHDNKSGLDSIRNFIVSNLFGESYVKKSNDSILPKFISDLKSDYKLTNEPMLEELDSTSLYSFNNEHNLEGFSLLNDEHIYSYGINRYVYMGGAHGLKTLNYFNFDLKTGKLITEKDLFINGYQEKLIKLIKLRIIEQSKESEDPEMKPIKNLDDTDYWVDAIKPNGNFYITDESLNYVFNPYEIAPYYMGITEVSLPFDRIKFLLKPKSIINYLIEK